MINEPPLSIESLSFAYAKTQILDQISFKVEPGSFTVLLGANGAGKTTLFSLISRLYSPGSGRIEIFGHDINRHSSKALSKMGVVFQNPALDQDLTIKQNLHYYASLYGISSSRAKQLLDEQSPVYLPECQFDQKIHQLSGGQKRRVELMRSLMHQPKLLLLDEPTVGLDINSREAFIKHVRALCEKQGIGVLWATHLIDEVEMSDQLVVLHQGKTRAVGDVGEIINQAQANDIGDVFLKLTREEGQSL